LARFVEAGVAGGSCPDHPDVYEPDRLYPRKGGRGGAHGRPAARLDIDNVDVGIIRIIRIIRIIGVTGMCVVRQIEMGRGVWLGFAIDLRIPRRSLSLADGDDDILAGRIDSRNWYGRVEWNAGLAVSGAHNGEMVAATVTGTGVVSAVIAARGADRDAGGQGARLLDRGMGATAEKGEEGTVDAVVGVELGPAGGALRQVGADKVILLGVEFPHVE
jgi:hypothetical protein